MLEIICTTISSRKCGDAIWLDGGKLLRQNWNKGDSVKIEESNNKIILQRVPSIAKSKGEIHNLSGRKNTSRGEISPILELPLKKCNVHWDTGSHIKCAVHTDRIVITLNNYKEERKKRLKKFDNLCNSETKISQLNLDISSLPLMPKENKTDNADIAILNYNPSQPASSAFYNALMSIENSNPFLVKVNHWNSENNVMQTGLISVLTNLEYKVYTIGTSLFAISNNIELDVEHLKESTSIVNLIGVSNDRVDKVLPKFGLSLGSKTDRTNRIVNDVINKTLTTASFFHGGGSFDHSYANAGCDLTQKLDLVSELEENYLSHSYDVNKKSFHKNTIILNGDIADYNFSNSQIKTTYITIGLSCKGASRAGRSKLKLSTAEEHQEAGFLFWPSIKAISHIDPSIVLIENTDSYASTSSFETIKLFLNSMGYSIDHGILNSNNFGAMETRKRLFLLACDDGETLKNETIFDTKDYFVGPRKCVSMIIDKDIPDTSPRYREYKGLKLKEIRDKIKGNGFSRSIYTGDETRTTLIRQSYQKAGSTDPYYQCPSNPSLSRLFTPLEHCRIKGFDEDFIRNGKTMAEGTLNSVLGQGGIRAVLAHISIKVNNIAHRVWQKSINNTAVIAT